MSFRSMSTRSNSSRRWSSTGVAVADESANELCTKLLSSLRPKITIDKDPFKTLENVLEMKKGQFTASESAPTNDLLKDFTPLTESFYGYATNLFTHSFSNTEAPPSTRDEVCYTYTLFTHHPTVRLTKILLHVCKHGRTNAFPPDKLITDELLSAFMKHYSYLPSFEGQISELSQMTRVMEGEASSNSNSSSNNRTLSLMKSVTFSSGLDKELEEHVSHMESILDVLYEGSTPTQKKNIRSLAMNILGEYPLGTRPGGITHANMSACGIPNLLRSLKKMMADDDIPNSEGEQYLMGALVPLHRVQGMILTEDHVPTLSLYHKQLMSCVSQELEKRPDKTEAVIKGICSSNVWTGGVTPVSLNGIAAVNSPKIVLLLEELDKLLTHLPDSKMRLSTLKVFLNRLCNSIQSDNSKIAERALQFWSNPTFETIIRSYWSDPKSKVGIKILKALCRTDAGMLKNWNPVVNKSLLSTLETVQKYDECTFWTYANQVIQNPKAANIKNAPPPPIPASLSGDSVKQMKTLRGQMTGGWNMPQVQVIVPGTASPKCVSKASVVCPEEDYSIVKVREYMASLKPPILEASLTKLAQSFKNSQLTEKPVRLPDLKFKDLVYGHKVLGIGAFGEVRYAKRIERGTSKSFWPEVAVKIVTTQRILQADYAKSIAREVAILETLNQPNIARLISSFCVRSGAYMVLEYASKGDLHTLINKNDRLSDEVTKFITGEIVAGLTSIHQAGFVFADLKPENVLIQENGHVKLTDFGGCRPIDDKGRNVISKAKAHVWTKKDMEWKWTRDEYNEVVPVGKKIDKDIRIEGSLLYLAPEVAMGGAPDISVDTWALGCVIHQCLSGRPPFLKSNQGESRMALLQHTVGNDIFSEYPEAEFTPDSTELISKCLNPTPSERPDMLRIPGFDYFGGVNVFLLYRTNATHIMENALAALPAGGINVAAPQPQGETPRQFGSIWEPVTATPLAPEPVDDNPLAMGKMPAETASTGCACAIM